MGNREHAMNTFPRISADLRAYLASARNLSFHSMHTLVSPLAKNFSAFVDAYPQETSLLLNSIYDFLARVMCNPANMNVITFRKEDMAYMNSMFKDLCRLNYSGFASTKCDLTDFTASFNRVTTFAAPTFFFCCLASHAVICRVLFCF
jgi:hypothetical protein